MGGAALQRLRDFALSGRGFGALIVLNVVVWPLAMTVARFLFWPAMILITVLGLLFQYQVVRTVSRRGDKPKT